MPARRPADSNLSGVVGSTWPPPAGSLCEVNIWWDTALWLLVLWLGALVFQIADLGTAWFDVRTARTGSGQLTRRRAHEIFWVTPLAALVALLLAFGIDLGVGMVLGQGWMLAGGVLLSLAVVVGVSTLTVVGLVALLTRDVQTYALLRYRVTEAKSHKVTKADVEGWREELAAIDAREAVRHESIARWLRLIPVGLAFLALAAVWVAILQDPSLPGWIAIGILAVVPPVGSILLAARSARLSLRARAEWALLQGKQRSEVTKALDELERRTGRGVAGLSDRVNRALQILREQQL